MKRILTLLSMAAILAVSCQEKEFEYPTPESGASYVFEGTVATDGFTWTTASSIGIYGLTDGLKIMNEEAKIEGWAVSVPYVDEETGETIYPEITPSQYDGKPVAPFNTPGLDLLKGENEFLVYAPYDPEMSYIPSLGVIYNLSISKAQTQPQPHSHAKWQRVRSPHKPAGKLSNQPEALAANGSFLYMKGPRL